MGSKPFLGLSAERGREGAQVLMSRMAYNTAKMRGANPELGEWGRWAGTVTSERKPWGQTIIHGMPKRRTKRSGSVS